MSGLATSSFSLLSNYICFKIEKKYTCIKITQPDNYKQVIEISTDGKDLIRVKHIQPLENAWLGDLCVLKSK